MDGSVSGSLRIRQFTELLQSAIGLQEA